MLLSKEQLFSVMAKHSERENDRHARKSTIISSQLPPVDWFDLFTDETVADAFIDRVIHTGHRIELKGDSLRKKG